MSAKSKQAQINYRTHVDVKRAYDAAVERLYPEVLNLTGGELSSGQLLEWFVAWFTAQPPEDRVALVRKLRQGYLACMERREQRMAPGSVNADKGALGPEGVSYSVGGGAREINHRSQRKRVDEHAPATPPVQDRPPTRPRKR